MSLESRTLPGISAARRCLAAGIVATFTVLAPVLGSMDPIAHAAGPLTGINLSTYVRVGRYDLPKTSNPPTASLLASEASGVTYNPDTDTLFVVGDAGTSVVQISKEGTLIDSMTLAAGSSPQGTEFYDTEGIAYVGSGKFVLTEERDRRASLFTYVAGTTLTRAAVQTVTLGTTVGNVGIEGVTKDPQTSGFIFVKELSPIGIFQTGIDFAAGTATNGSPTTVNSTNLFDPALAGLNDFSDVYSLANVTTLTGSDTSHLLVLSQESGNVVNIDRAGTVFSSLTIASDASNPLSVADQTNEGVTMDNDGNLYIVNEQGGGINVPQLWVYAPSAAPNQAPTGLALTNQITSILENTNTSTRVKVADVAITDDGLGTNVLSVSGADAGSFEVDGTGLHIKAGTVLDFETKTSYGVTVNVDDTTVGATPDASAAFSLTVTDVANETPAIPSLLVTEVSPWSSSGTGYSADWFEVTNNGTTAVDLTGYKFDDSSNSFGSAVVLNGVGSLAPGKSAAFLETTSSTQTAIDTTIAAFKTAWFGATVPAGFTIGSYFGSGVGLSTGGDAVNVYTAGGQLVTGVSFGTSTTGRTFDNSAAVGAATVPPPLTSALSTAGVHSAYLAPDGAETGSPGTYVPSLVITEVTPWSSGGTPYLADWLEVTNTGARAVDLTGWKMDDNSNAFGSAVTLTGVSSLGPGQSAVFLETTSSTPATIASTINAFKTAWFGGSAPDGFTIGSYNGSGVGLSTSGDAVNLFTSGGQLVTAVSFGAATPGKTFDNAAGVGGSTTSPPAISTLSIAGVNGAFVAADGAETGSPGAIAAVPPANVPEVPFAILLSISAIAILGASLRFRRPRPGAVVDVR